MPPTITFRVVDGTSYHEETPDAVVKALEFHRKRGTRIRLVYGDTKTGQSWHDQYDVTGTLSRSWGPTKVPILLHNRCSHAGGALLDHCIIGIRYANRKEGGWIYRHPEYKENE